MRLLTFQAAGTTRLGARSGPYVVDLTVALASKLTAEGAERPRDTARALIPADMMAFLAVGKDAITAAESTLRQTVGRLKAGEEVTGPQGEQVVFEDSEIRVEPPLRNPGKLICVMFNYHDALSARGMSIPEEPIIAGKYANAITGPYDPVTLPKMSQAVRYESELAVVIGARCKHVAEEHAYDVVAGYTVINDVSATDLVKRDKQALRGKSFDGFAPMGPCFVTKDEVPDPHGLRVQLELNGKPFVDSSTSQMVYRIPQLVAFLSQVFTLEPGDIIATGAPADLPSRQSEIRYLRPGDLMTTSVEGIGQLRNPVV